MEALHEADSVVVGLSPKPRPTPPPIPAWFNEEINADLIDASALGGSRTPQTSPLRTRARTASRARASFSTPLQYHGTPPSPVNADRKRPAQSTLVRPTPMKMLTADDDEMETEHPEVRHDDIVIGHEPSTEELIERECEKNGWTGRKGQGLPVTDPFKLLALCSSENPWGHHRLHLLTPQQLSTCLENVYSNASSICHALRFAPRKGDLMVCGVYRSGTTPAMQILASLKYGRVVEKMELLKVSDWLEALHPPRDPIFKRHDEGSRLIRTHMPLRVLFGGAITPSPRAARPEFHVVVMLRDPADLRLSWYRHVRRVYHKFNPEDGNFESHFSVNDFANVLMYAVNPNISTVVVNHADYENFVSECLKVAVEDQHPQVLVCFYEELLMNPVAFVQKIADFTGQSAGNTLLIEQIAHALTMDEDFPFNFTPPPSPIASLTEATSAQINLTLHSARHSNPVFQTGYPGDSAQSSMTSVSQQSRHRKGSSGQGRRRFSKESLRKFDFKWRDIVAINGLGHTTYEKLIFSVSPIFLQIAQQNSFSSSSSGGLGSLLRMRAGSMASVLAPKGLPRLGSFTSFFKTKPMSPNNEDHEDVDGGTEHDSEASHLAALFGEMPSSTESSRGRARTSSLMSFGSFRETSFAVGNSASRSRASTMNVEITGGQEIDPDDSGDEEDVNMFLDHSKSKLYGTRKTRAQSNLSTTSFGSSFRLLKKT